jgi:transcriptional regulator with XRE-family HTH domain
MQAFTTTVSTRGPPALSIAQNDQASHLFPVSGRQSKDPARVRALGERIDAIATEKGITTRKLQDAAGVTWAAADRWRKGKAWPEISHLRAVARVLGVTIDDLLGPDEYEPPYEAWRAFLDTPTAKKLTAAERRWLATQYFPDELEPTLSVYLTLAEARHGLRKREPS